MQPAGTTVRTANRGDISALRATLARAFADDPVTGYLVGSDLGRLSWFFGSQVREWMRNGEVLTAPGGEAAALWGKPGAWHPSLLDVLRASPAMMMSLRTRLPRGLRLLTIMERGHPRAPHWYLAVLGTDPSSQGKGLGAALVNPVLERCDREGVGAYLESSKESNIPYYERFGFKVTGEIVVPRGPTLWPMWRDPQA